MTTAGSLKESHARSVLKAISYQMIGTLTTVALVFWATGDLKICVAIVALEPFVKTVVYYLHERAWQQVPRGQFRKLLRTKDSVRAG